MCTTSTGTPPRESTPTSGPPTARPARNWPRCWPVSRSHLGASTAVVGASPLRIVPKGGGPVNLVDGPAALRGSGSYRVRHLSADPQEPAMRQPFRLLVTGTRPRPGSKEPRHKPGSDEAGARTPSRGRGAGGDLTFIRLVRTAWPSAYRLVLGGRQGGSGPTGPSS